MRKQARGAHDGTTSFLETSADKPLQWQVKSSPRHRHCETQLEHCITFMVAMRTEQFNPSDWILATFVSDLGNKTPFGSIEKSCTLCPGLPRRWLDLDLCSTSPVVVCGEVDPAQDCKLATGEFVGCIEHDVTSAPWLCLGVGYTLFLAVVFHGGPMCCTPRTSSSHRTRSSVLSGARKETLTRIFGRRFTLASHSKSWAESGGSVADLGARQ